MESTVFFDKINSYFYHEWYERLQDDGMFETEDDTFEHVKSWRVSADNCDEFIQALSLGISEDELKVIIKNQGSSDGSCLFVDLVKPLGKFLMEEKGQTFEQVINMDQHSECYVPIDRISKFLKMMQMELEATSCQKDGKLDTIEAWKLHEIRYSLSKLNK